MTASGGSSAQGFTLGEVVAIECAAVHAWPAAEVRNIGGWLWRYSGGSSQRANSVSTLKFEGDNVTAAIREAEALYRARGAPSRFQVGSRILAPPGLDRQLEAAGYRRHEPVTTLAKRLAGPPADQPPESSDRPDDDWMEVYLSNISPDRRAAAGDILAAVPEPRAFLALRRKGQVVATALAVLCGEVVIAECVGTRAEARRTGAATDAMACVETWGIRHGARIAALQAVTANAPAQALYTALDYSPVGGYHYRILGS